MKQLGILLVVLSLSGCAIVGEKDALVVQGSDWTTQTLFSNVSYHFQCDEMWVELDEIVFESKTSSYGPILPLIPSDRHIDKTKDNLELKFQIVGKSQTRNHGKGDFALTLEQGDSELDPPIKIELNKIAEKPFEGAFWVQYQLSYLFETKLEALSALSIDLRLPFSQCTPSILHLQKESVSDNEFILAPGA